MRAQRVREGESRVEMQSAKWTAEGTVKGRYFVRVLCDVEAYVSCRGYAGILQSARSDRESRWHRGNDMNLPSLTE